MSVIDALRAADGAVLAGDDATALVHLLAAWRAVPDAELAAVITRVGDAAARALARPTGVDEARWHALARRRDPVALAPVAATLADAPTTEARVARARVLAKVRDPRASAALFALVAAEPSVAARVATFWVPMVQLLAACGDPRVRGWFEGLRLAAQRGPWWTERTRRRLVQARVASWHEAIAAAYPERPRLAPDARAVVDTLVARLDARAGAARDLEAGADVDPAEPLLAAIYADPAADAPRAIYADTLLARGDPLGELIALQLAHAHGPPPAEVARRIAHLIATHRATWLGPLAAHVERATWRRGFLAEVTVRVDPWRRFTPPASPRWATVVAIANALPATDRCPMPALAHADRLPPEALLALAELAAPPPVVTLGTAAGTAPRTLAALARALPRVSPTLRYLALADAIDDPALIPIAWETAALRGVRARVDDPAAIARWLARAPRTPVETFELTTRNARVAIAARGTRVEITAHSARRDWWRDPIPAMATVAELLARPAAAAVRAVAVVAPPGILAAVGPRYAALGRARPELAIELTPSSRPA